MGGRGGGRGWLLLATNRGPRHTLRAEVEATVDATLTVEQAHHVAHGVEYQLLHAVPRLTAAIVHAELAVRAEHARPRRAGPPPLTIWAPARPSSSCGVELLRRHHEAHGRGPIVALICATALSGPQTRVSGLDDTCADRRDRTLLQVAVTSIVPSGRFAPSLAYPW